MKEKEIKCSKGDVTVIWTPGKCIHSAKCATGLPEVFTPDQKPWINMDGAPVHRIIDQVGKCPSGALAVEQRSEISAEKQIPRIEVLDKGPYLVKGSCIIVNEDGSELIKEGNVALCRCGASLNKPYCDGSHRNTDH